MILYDIYQPITISISLQIENAGAARAVGSALSSYPLLLVIPCHRVIRADGSPGNYKAVDILPAIHFVHQRGFLELEATID